MRFLLCAALLSSACAVRVDEGAPAQERSPITHAAIDEGDAAVVALVHGRASFCSGVLVGARAVVTAAHCVTPRAPDAVRFATTVGDDESDDAATVGVVRVAVEPSFDPGTLDHDLAIVELDADAPVAPVALALDAPLPAQGAAARIVGFGPTDPYADPERRSGEAALADVAPSSFELAPAPSLPCGGDSGGAVFFFAPDGDGEELLFGVVSRGDAACVDHAWATRIDAHAAFVRASLAEAASSPPPSAASCAVAASRDRAAGSFGWLVVVLTAAASARSWFRSSSRGEVS